MANKPPLTTRDIRVRRAIQAVLWLPALILLALVLTGNLTVNPIQAATQRTGQIAIVMLALSFACSPVKLFFPWGFLSYMRKTFGLYAFYYAMIHVILFTVVDYGLNIQRLIVAAVGKPFIYVGLVVFTILLAMAVTSNKPAKVWLGKNWKRLHRLVYIAAPLAGLHFAWALKGDLFHLSGNIIWPMVYLVIITILLVLRIPAVRRRIIPLQIKAIWTPKTRETGSLPEK
jgi:methionine sulfoxide reductase heme-binding subunit